MGDSPKWVKSRRRRRRKKKKKKKRANDGKNNDEATHGARKHAWRTQTAWAKITIIERLGPGTKRKSEGKAFGQSISLN